ncbi:hypothetical protein CANCADRAFT_33025 [Tortispora caseinolytica NRRL Y-17796]|uniref:Uncharacterized protein n=1 Tax=Tortispora caseinolytica NRRL Y-17796 TaxID=767744 RepID=A0A1E4T9G9_9ASCO|nr:hypothetical protein CANCADRAFT_33025 [Tortispora caseinolytica NRRL Y-17796]
MVATAAHKGGINDIVLDEKGMVVVSVGQDQCVRVGRRDGEEVHKWEAHSRPVLAVDLREDRIATGSLDRSAIVWDAATGQQIRRFTEHHGPVYATSFAPNGALLASGSLDGTVKLWDLRATAYKPLQTLSEATDVLSTVQFGTTSVVTGSYDGRLRRYDLRQAMVSVDSVGSPILHLAANDQKALVTTQDSKVSVLNFADGSINCVFSDPARTTSTYKIQSAFSDDYASFFTGSENGLVFAHKAYESPDSATVRVSVDAQHDIVSAIAQRNSYLVAGTSAGRLWIWDVLSIW